jgi:hypothetical protein
MIEEYGEETDPHDIWRALMVVGACFVIALFMLAAITLLTLSVVEYFK